MPYDRPLHLQGTQEAILPLLVRVCAAAEGEDGGRRGEAEVFGVWIGDGEGAGESEDTMSTRVLETQSGCVVTIRENGRPITGARCYLCSWGKGRFWEREQNAITKLAEHLMTQHRIQLTLERGGDVALGR
jgi:hypothetical protein